MHNRFASRALLAGLVLATAACTGTAPAPGTSTPTAGPTTGPTAHPTAQATPAPSPSAAATPTTEPGMTAAPTATGATGGLPDLARIAAGETPAGWKEVRSTDGVCRMAVPPDWDTETMPSAGISPGFEAQALMSNDQLANYGSFDAYIETAKTVYFGPDRIVLIETDELFLMTAGPSTPDASFLVGRNLGESVCGILLTIRGNAIADFLATGQQVLYSLAPAD